MNRNQFPKARKEALIIKELGDETLVYDRNNDQAHCLNQTAALVWEHCDGDSNVSEIAESLAKQTSTKANETIVWLALDQLHKFDLLESALPAHPHLAGVNRRQWVRNVGLAAIALPIIISIAAPAAQAAASCTAPGGACGSNNQCCSNQCCGSPGVPACPVNNVCV